MDEEGFYKVVGRIKEIIITAGGENVAPTNIEDEIRQELPALVSMAVICGDGRKFLTCLLTLKVEVDPATMAPTEQLEAGAAAWLKEVSGQQIGAPNPFHSPSCSVSGAVVCRYGGGAAGLPCLARRGGGHQCRDRAGQRPRCLQRGQGEEVEGFAEGILSRGRRALPNTETQTIPGGQDVQFRNRRNVRRIISVKFPFICKRV